MIRKIFNITRSGFLSVKDQYKVKFKNETFVPLNAKQYRSMKIMFHKKIPKYIGACEYPLSVKTITDNETYDIRQFYKKYKANKYICFVEIYGLKPKYNNIVYNIYVKQLGIALNEDVGIRWIGWVNDIDLSNIIKLYNYDKIIIRRTQVFENVGSFGDELNEFITQYYDKLHKMEKGTQERKDIKTCLHIATYGKNVQKISKLGIRSKYVLVGMYQSAYVRKRMIDIFIKYKNDIIYMDTDSVMIRKNAKFRERISDKIGQFKIEYENITLDIFRPKAYIIYDKNGNIIEQKFSGIKTKLNEKQIEKIKHGETITIKEKRKDKMQKIKIYDIVNNGYKVKI